MENNRRKRKRIIRLKDDDGSLIEDEVLIHSLVKTYFVDLFTSSPSVYSPIIEVVQPFVSIEDNKDLDTV